MASAMEKNKAWGRVGSEQGPLTVLVRTAGKTSSV